MIKVYDRSFIIHEVPLEKFYTDDGKFIVEVDDTNLKRKRIIFDGYGGIKMVFEDTILLSEYECKDLKNKEYHRVIMINEDSKWIKELELNAQKNYTNFIETYPGARQYKHFIMFIGDYVFEILSYDCKVEDI